MFVCKAASNLFACVSACVYVIAWCICLVSIERDGAYVSNGLHILYLRMVSWATSRKVGCTDLYFHSKLCFGAR